MQAWCGGIKSAIQRERSGRFQVIEISALGDEVSPSEFVVNAHADILPQRHLKVSEGEREEWPPTWGACQQRKGTCRGRALWRVVCASTPFRSAAMGGTKAKG